MLAISHLAGELCQAWRRQVFFYATCGYVIRASLLTCLQLNFFKTHPFRFSVPSITFTISNCFMAIVHQFPFYI